MVGSFEITEMLRKRFETMLSSGQWASSAGAWVDQREQPLRRLVRQAARLPHARQRRAHHLRRHGADAKVRIDGQKITLSKDGTFSYHFVFPDGQFHIPIEATSADGVETRSALLSFLRMTETDGDVRKTGQPKMDEPIGRKK